MTNLSANTKAILMLVSPLIAGGSTERKLLLTHREYTSLAKSLQQIDSQPADLIDREKASDILKALEKHQFDQERLSRLLGRGMQLGLALEHWQQRSIQVFSRADDLYPQGLKKALHHQSPALLYVCGMNLDLLRGGGLAVVGSRRVNADLLDYARRVGELAASADCAIVSGGAKGVDQAAMQGAAAAGGNAIGVVANSLEATVLRNRDDLMNGRLLLCSPFDPAERFQVWRAMDRNKLIYALSDVALVVESDVGKGGTWQGAVEQIQKLKVVPVYTRTSGPDSRGLEALRRLGAHSWPEFDDESSFREFMQSRQALLQPVPTQKWEDKLFKHAQEIILQLLSSDPLTLKEVGEILNTTPRRTSLWLKHLLEADKIEKLREPTRYRSKENGQMFLAYESVHDPKDKLLAYVEEIVLHILDSGPLTLKEVESSLASTPKNQISLWLKELLEREKIEKTFNPTRYQIREKEQMSLV